MSDAPNTSQYILVNPDPSLPNSRTLEGGTGITLEDSGSGNNLTIEPYGNIRSIFDFDTSGFMVYNSFDNTFTGVSFSGGSTINIVHPDGTTGNPIFNVIHDTTIQKITSQVGGVTVSTRSRLNFMSGSGVSISIFDNVPNNSADVTITSSGSEPLSPNLEAIAGLTPTSGSLIVGNGTTYISIPIGPDNTVPTSNGTTWSWEPISGGGTVTSITAGTGLSGGTITTSGTISIANTAVTPGSYTNANITVNSHGQITAASNGGGGGGGTVTSITAGQNLVGGTITTSGTIALSDIITGLTSVEVGNLTLENNSINSTGNVDIDANGSLVLGPITGFVDNVKTLTSSLSPMVYNVKSHDSVIIADSTNANTTIVLPNSPVNGQTYKIIDGTGNASNFPVYLDGNGQTIDGMPQIFNFVDLPDIDQAATLIITPNGNYIYIFNYDNTVTVYKDANTESPTFLTTLTLPFLLSYVAITADGKYMYVNDGVNKILQIKNINTDTPIVSGVLFTTSSSTITSMQITPDGNNIFVPNYSIAASLITIYKGASTDTPSLAAEFTVAPGGSPLGNVVITPNGNYAYIPVVTGSAIVSVIQNASSATPSLLTTLSVQGYPNNLSVTPDGNYIYVMNTMSASISVIGGASSGSPSVINTIPTPLFTQGPNLSLITPDGNYLYVSNSIGEGIMVIQNVSSNTPSLLKILNVYSGIANISSFQMSPDGKYIYIYNSGADDPNGVSITIIQNASTNNPSVLTTILYNMGIVFTPDGKYVYTLQYNPDLPNPSINKVTQIPAADIIPHLGVAPTKLLGVGSAPYAIATTPNGIYAYVSNNGDGTVSIIQNTSVTYESSSSPSVLTTLTVGGNPTFITLTPNGENAYVLNSNDSTLSVIQNASTTRWPYFQTIPTILTTLSVHTNAQSLAMTPNGNILYVGNTSTDGNIGYITNASSNAPSVNLLPLTAGVSPAEVVVTPDGNYAYIGNSSGNSIIVVSNASTSPTVHTTLTTSYHCYFMFTTPDGNYVYSLNSEDGFVTIVENAQSGSPSVLKTLATGTLPLSMAITPNGYYGYIANFDSDDITVIQGANTSDPTVLTTLSVGAGPYAIAVSPDGNYVYVTSSTAETVTIIQGASNGSPNILTTIFVGSQPESINITPDGNYIYIGNKGDANVAQILCINNNNVNIDSNYGSKQIVYNGVGWSSY